MLATYQAQQTSFYSACQPRLLASTFRMEYRLDESSRFWKVCRFSAKKGGKTSISVCRIYKALTCCSLRCIETFGSASPRNSICQMSVNWCQMLNQRLKDQAVLFFFTNSFEINLSWRMLIIAVDSLQLQLDFKQNKCCRTVLHYESVCCNAV